MNLVPRRRESYWLDPLTELKRIHREMDSFFEGSLLRGSDGQGLYDSVWSPAVDLAEADDQYTVTAELPGLDRKDIEVTLQDGVLTIKGERKEEREERRKGTVRRERFYGSFFREISLPAAVDESKIQAEYRNGVLELSLPKKEEAKAKGIKVEVK